MLWQIILYWPDKASLGDYYDDLVDKHVIGGIVFAAAPPLTGLILGIVVVRVSRL
jgi:hypothetical protein